MPHLSDAALDAQIAALNPVPGRICDAYSGTCLTPTPTSSTRVPVPPMPDLPRTGTDVGTVILGALALLLAGFGMWLVARSWS